LKISIIIISLIFEISLLLIITPLVYTGDFLSYRNLYEVYENADISAFLTIDTAGIVGSRDYGFNTLVYFFSKFSNYDYFIIIISFSYFLVMAKLLNSKNIIFLLPIMPFTFYIVGLQFSAIRLELAITIFLFFYLNNNSKLTFISALFHAQIAPIFIQIVNKNNLYKILTIFGIISIMAIVYSPYIIEKFILYSNANSEIQSNWFREFGFILYSIIIVCLSKNKICYTYIIKAILFSPLIFFLGAARINILLFLLMLLNLDPFGAMTLRVRAGLLVFFFYDIYKGILFISGLLQGNSGFENITTIF